MGVTFLETGPPAGEEEIEQLEGLAQAPLPSSYKAFLIRQDGARPENNILSTDARVGVTQFLSVDEMVSLLRRDEFPKQLLPIADADGGNRLYLSLVSEDDGAVYFWDHEFGDPGEPEAMSRVAAGFDELIERLNHMGEVDLGERAVSGWVDPDFARDLGL